MEPLVAQIVQLIEDDVNIFISNIVKDFAGQEAPTEEDLRDLWNIVATNFNLTVKKMGNTDVLCIFNPQKGKENKGIPCEKPSIEGCQYCSIHEKKRKLLEDTDGSPKKVKIEDEEESDYENVETFSFGATPIAHAALWKPRTI